MSAIPPGESGGVWCSWTKWSSLRRPLNRPDDRLKQALSAVPEKLKVPLLLHYLEGFSVAEVAQILRIPQGTVKSRLHHARKRLRREWEAMKE